VYPRPFDFALNYGKFWINSLNYGLKQPVAAINRRWRRFDDIRENTIAGSGDLSLRKSEI